MTAPSVTAIIRAKKRASCSDALFEDDELFLSIRNRNKD